MTTRTYRVQVTGQFASLTPERKAQLRKEQADHDVFVSAFTPEGTFTYTPALSRFTLRYLLDLVADSAAQADEEALVEAELMADCDRLVWPHRDGPFWPHGRRAGVVVTV